MATEPVRVQQALKFGEDFELDLRSYELRRSGQTLKLEPTPFGILVLLIEQRGELVSRQQIVERIWGKGVFLDTDNSINGAIRKIRQALNDDREDPRYIQTLTGRGYRFIAPVVELDEEPQRPPFSQAAPDAPVASATTPSTKGKFRTVFWSALVVVVLVGAALWLLKTRSQTNPLPSVRSIAVLPLANLSGDPSQDFFAEGMTDQLITDLAKVSALRVTSRTSVMRYKGTKKSLPEIARELNVDGVIEGSVTRSGQRVRITAQLLHAPTDRHLWAETYDRDLGDVLKLQSEVAEAIAEQVRAELTPQQKAQLRAARPVDPDAYEAYIRGRYYLSNQFTMAQPLNAAKGYFEEAVQKDPSFALAYSGLADSYLYLAIFRQLPPKSAYKSALEALRKAQRLDDSIGEIHDTLGTMKWRFGWDVNTAEREFNQAIALAPSYSCAHEDRAIYLSFMGRRADALAEIAKSNQIDPGPSSAMAEAASYYQLRDYDNLIEASQRGIASNPNEWTQYYNLGVGYEGTGKQLEAIFEYQKAVEMSDGDQDATAALAHAYAANGRRAEAQKILRNFEAKSKTAFVSPYVMATVYASLGDKDKAFDLLERAYQEQSLELSWHLKADLRIDSLRSDPRFQIFLHRMGLA